MPQLAPWYLSTFHNHAQYTMIQDPFNTTFEMTHEFVFMNMEQILISLHTSIVPYSRSSVYFKGPLVNIQCNHLRIWPFIITGLFQINSMFPLLPSCVWQTEKLFWNLSGFSLDLCCVDLPISGELCWICFPASYCAKLLLHPDLKDIWNTQEEFRSYIILCMCEWNIHKNTSVHFM